jgi:phosphoribosylaminoimidazole-succinocarboxamide synthase
MTMDVKARLAEGKTKIVYAHPHDPVLAVVVHKDGITAGDGARRNVIPGKGVLSGRTTSNVFALLAQAGIATHFVAAPTPDTMIVRRCTMIPLEVVTRRVATGSYVRRHPDISAGQRFDPPLIEFFLKDDARHDPQIDLATIVADNLASTAEVERMMITAQQVFLTLEQAWQQLDVVLVDLKIEFGRDAVGALLVADVIDNDSWRIWPQGDPQRMLDKQVYRNLTDVTEQALEDIRQRYEQVAALTDTWQVPHES